MMKSLDMYVPSGLQIFLLFVMLGVGAMLGAAVIAVLAVLGVDLSTRPDLMTLVIYPLQFLPVFIYAWLMGRSARPGDEGVKVDSGHFKPAGGAVCAVVAVVLTLCGGFVSDWFTSLLPAMPESIKVLLESMTGGDFIVNFICVSVLAPVCEELMLRGMVLRGMLAHKVSPALAIIVSAFLFALIHMNPWQAVPAFIMGCAMGYVYYRTGSLKLTMLMHCTNNTFALCLSQFAGLEDETWQDVLQQPVAYWLVFASCALLVILCVRVFARIPLDHARGNLDLVVKS